MAVAGGSDNEPFAFFLEECAREYEQTQRELKEIDLFIQQTTAEVERLAQRNTQAANRLRQIEAALDTVPRPDIKEAYTTVLNTQQRLFMMRGQLEKLQSNQQNLGRYLELLHKILELGAQTVQGVQDKGKEEADSSQTFVVRIIEAQERERQRLSRQIHDGPAQSLTNLILQAEICERFFDSDPERARTELANLRTAVAATFQKVRGFILSLRPMMLDDLGVVPTLRRYVETFSENKGVSARLIFTGKEKRFAPHKEVTVFRLIQELMDNAVEYGHATNIQISLDLSDELARASVEDNGSGFDLPDTLTSPEADRLGLRTMRERVEMLGGRISFDSALGRGTKVWFELPIA